MREEHRVINTVFFFLLSENTQFRQDILYLWPLEKGRAVAEPGADAQLLP